jgi:hypothetical protein
MIMQLNQCIDTGKYDDITLKEAHNHAEHGTTFEFPSGKRLRWQLNHCIIGILADRLAVSVRKTEETSEVYREGSRQEQQPKLRCAVQCPEDKPRAGPK